MSVGIIKNGNYNLVAGINGHTKVYESNEIVVGTWIDGKPIYRKIIDDLPFPATASDIQQTRNHISKAITRLNMSDVKQIVSAEFFAIPVAGTTGDLMHLPRFWQTSSDAGEGPLIAFILGSIVCQNGNIDVHMSTNRTGGNNSFYKGRLIMEYIKN